MLEFLFYMKNQGNFTAHPSNSENTIINPNTHIFKNAKGNDDINKVREKMEKLLKSQFMQKNFVVPINPSAILDCLFESKLKPLINSKNNIEINNRIDTLLGESLSGTDESKKVKELIENYSNLISKLEEILETLNNKNTLEEQDNIIFSKPLKEFLGRLEEIMENEQKILPFLYRLSDIKYESSITGENYVFYSSFLYFTIKKLSSKLNGKIEMYRKDMEALEYLIESKKKNYLFFK